MISGDWLFIVMCIIYFKFIADFMASLAPPPKARKRSGRWTQDDSKH